MKNVTNLSSALMFVASGVNIRYPPHNFPKENIRGKTGNKNCLLTV
jgi:hypothetical protein